LSFDPASKIFSSLQRASNNFAWDDYQEDSISLLNPFSGSMAIFSSTIFIEGISSTTATITYSYFASKNFSRNLVPFNSFLLTDKVLNTSFQIGPCGTGPLRTFKTRIWTQITGFLNSTHDKAENITGETVRYYEEASLEPGRSLLIMFNYAARYRFYLIEVANDKRWKSNFFLFTIRLKRQTREFTWAETFQEVRLTSQRQCPEFPKSEEPGIYHVWLASSFNETDDEVALIYQVPSDFPSNFTVLSIGLVINDLVVNFYKSQIFSIEVSVSGLPLPPDDLPNWGILLGLCSSLIILIIVAIIALWTRKKVDYLPLNS